MAIQNPTKYVTVRRLNRFRQKILAEMPSSTVATDATCIAAAAEIIFTPPVEEEELVEEPENNEVEESSESE